MTDTSASSPPDPTETVLDRMDDGFFALDPEWQVTFANERGRDILRAAMPAVDDNEPVVGRHLWDEIPAAVDTTFYQQYTEAMETQTAATFEEWFEPLETWFTVRAFPSPSGLSVYFQDVTERRELEQSRQESLYAFQRLYAISSDRERAFPAKLEAILDVGRDYLDLPNGFLTRITADAQHIETAVGTHPDLQEGGSCPLEEAYCKRTVELDQLLTVVNASEEGWVDDPAYDRFKLDTYIGGRILVDDDLYGTLCFAASDARDRPFSDTERTFVELLTRWVSYELGRRQMAEQLERRQDRLEQFASVVSHDLRNPLAVATGRAELLDEEVDSDHIPPLRTSLDRMDELIEDILQLAREGPTAANTAPVALDAVVTAAWQTAETADASLDLQTPEAVVVADESRLQRLFENLFRNAAEHGGEGVTVGVGLLSDGSGFFVENDGPEIPAEDADRIFEAGYTTERSGTGFGLGIVEQIASAHGWTTRLTDREGGGPRFEFDGVDVSKES
jgi:signal transduction histidine kinase